MLQFRLSKEIEGNRQVIEVWEGDLFIASIYPHEKKITVISKYFKCAQVYEGTPPILDIFFHL